MTDKMIENRTVKATKATLAALLIALCASCGGNVNDGKVTERVRDHKAYSLGEQHAAQLISVAHDEAAVQDRLLDVRARISNIESKIGPQSAHDYESGFVDAIRRDCDSLSRIIF